MINPVALTKNRILVDTDVVSYIFNKHSQAQFFQPYLSNKSLAISFITVAQLFYGAYHAGWGNNKLTSLENHLKNYVVLPYDYDVCLKWAKVRNDCEHNGHPIESADCWIAACALRHDCALATNNGRHFKDIKGLSLICPSLS